MARSTKASSARFAALLITTGTDKYVEIVSIPENVRSLPAVDKRLLARLGYPDVNPSGEKEHASWMTPIVCASEIKELV